MLCVYSSQREKKCRDVVRRSRPFKKKEKKEKTFENTQRRDTKTHSPEKASSSFPRNSYAFRIARGQRELKNWHKRNARISRVPFLIFWAISAFARAEDVCVRVQKKAAFFLENHKRVFLLQKGVLFFCDDLSLHRSACAGASSAFPERRRLYYIILLTHVTRVSRKTQFFLCRFGGSRLLLLLCLLLLLLKVRKGRRDTRRGFHQNHRHRS